MQAIYTLSSEGGGWVDVAPHLLIALGWCAALFTVGPVLLKRKVETL
mgnify:CR=1 FL=1